MAQVHALREHRYTGDQEADPKDAGDAESALRAALLQSEERFHALAEASGAIAWRASPEGSFVDRRDGASQRGGWLETIHPDDREEILARWRGDLASRQPGATRHRVRSRNGEHRWVSASRAPLFDPDGALREWVGALSDVTDQQRLDDRLRFALRAGRMVVWELDLERDFVTCSDNSVGLLGIGSGPLLNFLDRIPAEDRSWRDDFTLGSKREGSSAIEFRFRRPDGTLMWLGTRAERAGPARIAGVSFDITDRKAAEEEIWRGANHDVLTGLPNRVLFQGRLERALGDARRNGTSASLLLIDLDNFKEVNDTLGHDAGDALLTEIAARLSHVTRDCDPVARIGGDEFAILVVEPLRLEHAVRYADIVIERLRQPFTYDGRMLLPQASIGVAAFPNHGSTPAELMKDADIALYRAKAQGRNRAVAYSPDMRLAAERRTALGRDMRQALRDGRIVPFYQPKVCLSTGRIVGFEALARWRHPGRGVLTPAVFGSLFDDPESASLLGRQLIAGVASDMRAWRKDGLDVGRVSVNLSSAEFNCPGLADEVLSILKQQGVPGDRFGVEIAETVLLQHGADHVAAILDLFHHQGVHIALDDFGTGYASLTHLRQFPIDEVKIDRSLILNLDRDGAVVKAIIGVGNSLDLRITAEGVETEAQARRLRTLGCHQAQGYFYARPMGVSQAAGFIASFRPDDR